MGKLNGIQCRLTRVLRHLSNKLKKEINGVPESRKLKLRDADTLHPSEGFGLNTKNCLIRNSLWLPVVYFACLCASNTSAELIQFTFTGEVTEIGGELWDPWLDTQLGDSVTVQYIVDSNAEDNALGPHLGLYFVSELTFAISGVFQTAVSGSIVIDNNYAYPWQDQYATTFILGDEQIGSFSFSGTELFSSDALPTDVDWVQNATDHNGMTGFAPDNSRFIRYQFTSWNAVVVPGAPTLLVLLLGISRKRRRH